MNRLNSLCLSGMLCILVWTTDVSSQDEQLPLADKLVEAQDYLVVKPSRSFELLSGAVDLSSLNEAQRLQWHLTKMRAAVAINQIDNILLDTQAVMGMSKTQAFASEATEIFRITGIVLRKLGYWRDANASYQCALNLTEDDGQKLAVLISMAVLARHLEGYESARVLYKEAESIAIQTNNRSALATVANNLGAVLLDLGELDTAKVYYLKAYDEYQRINKRSGVITTGTNLLLVAVIQNDLIGFQRVIEPVTRLINDFPDTTKKALLTWLVAADQVNQGKVIEAETKAALLSAFEHIETVQLKALLSLHLAPRLDVVVEVPEKPIVEDKPPLIWLEGLHYCMGLNGM